MISLQKNYDALVYAFFLSFFLKGTAKGACAQVSSIRCQVRSQKFLSGEARWGPQFYYIYDVKHCDNVGY